ncbi:hypothetical protein ADIS_4810 [Lunatimonas lonarensis]|uniref:Alkyl hydroperoxide reductase subunit C/ Thiol specific antioxidant domain-containing protein n=2 Tax=Lunatimonas lonarensis TaxID=1232681 RepID=R7ZKZ7_9BACT|nr:hypothetical protein ADIS_4810 [Lunatimonas lonarensis]
MLGTLLLVMVGMAFSIQRAFLDLSVKDSRRLQWEDLGLILVRGVSVTESAPYSSLVVVYFNSTCDLCVHELAQIKGRLGEFVGVPLVFISSEEREEIEEVAAGFEEDQGGFVTFLQDESQLFATAFSVTGVPETFVFGEDGAQRWRFRGPVKVQSILNQLAR